MSVQNTMLPHVDHYFGGHAELLNMHERLADLLLLAQGLSSQDDAGKALQHCMLSSICILPLSSRAGHAERGW